MSDKMRWRYGNNNPVMSRVKSNTIIEIGDLVFLETSENYTFPASYKEPCLGVKEFFTRGFLGVAMQRSRKGDTDDIRVATSGVFEFDAVFDPEKIHGFQLGDRIAVAIKDDYNLYKQVVTWTDRVCETIGKVAKNGYSSEGTILFEIHSKIMARN